MAIVAHLVEKNIQSGDTVVNGVAAVVMAIDDAVETTSALIQQATVDRYNALVGANTLPVGYFDTNRPVALTWDADDDITVVNGRSVVEAIA